MYKRQLPLANGCIKSRFRGQFLSCMNTVKRIRRNVCGAVLQDSSAITRQIEFAKMCIRDRSMKAPLTQERAKTLTKDLLFFVAGSLIYAVSVKMFTAPNHIASGGVTGLSIVLNYLFQMCIRDSYVEV